MGPSTFSSGSAARAFKRAAAAACLLAVCACGTVPESDVLIELHTQAVTLHRPTAYQGGGDGQAHDRNHLSGVQDSRPDRTADSTPD